MLHSKCSIVRHFIMILRVSSCGVVLTQYFIVLKFGCLGVVSKTF